MRTVEAGGVAFAVREWGEAGSPSIFRNESVIGFWCPLAGFPLTA